MSRLSDSQGNPNGRPDTRQLGFDGQLDLGPGRLVFIDETGASTRMARLRGRAPRGEQRRAPIQRGHWKTTTLTGGLRRSGLVAPMVLDGPMDGVCFRTYVEQVLVRELRPGDIVIMDNLPAHKIGGVRQAIEAARPSLLYLPPCSPDINLIEMAYAKLKALLRKAAKRTVGGFWDTIGHLIDTFTQTECANYFAAAGHDHE